MAFEDLNARILLLNDQYTCSLAPNTRGLFGRWFLRILGGDAMGAAIGSPLGGIGAILCGIIGSLTTASVAIAESDSEEYLPADDNLFEEAAEEEIVALSDDYEDSDSAEKDYAVIYDGFDKVGSVHNDVIYDIYAAGDTEIGDLTRDEILRLTVAKVSESYEGEIPEEVLAGIETNGSLVFDSFCGSIDEDPYVGLAHAMPQYANEFSVIKDFCETVAGLCYDKALVRSYLDAFMEIVTDSKVSQTSKNMLKAAACVGSNSSLMWRLGEVEEIDPEENE